MTRPTVTLMLPSRRGGAWWESLLDAFAPAAARLAARLGLPEPLVVSRPTEGDPALGFRGTHIPLPDHDEPVRLALAFATVLEHQAYPALLAPALAARGIEPRGFWLPQAAARGLGLEALRALAAGRAREETIAWRLAERFPPDLALIVPPEAPQQGADPVAIRAAADRAARWCGLPIPVPGLRPPDPGLEPGATALAVGATRLRLRALSDLDSALVMVAGATVDPGLVIGLCLETHRMSRRLAARALADGGAVRIAEAIIRDHRDGRLPIDLVSLAARAAGLDPGG